MAIRARFNRDLDFVVGRPLRLSGQDLVPGQPFDKTLVTTRRLRQMYEFGQLRLASASAPVPSNNVHKAERIKVVRRTRVRREVDVLSS